MGHASEIAAETYPSHYTHGQEANNASPEYQREGRHRNCARNLPGMARIRLSRSPTALLLFFSSLAVSFTSSAASKLSCDATVLGESRATDETSLRFGHLRDRMGSDSIDIDKNPIRWNVPWGREEHYRFGNVLGSGAHGTVHLARDLRTNTSVAIKCLKLLRPHWIFREMSAMIDLRHVNVVELRDAFIQRLSNSVCLVLELLEKSQTLETFQMPHEDIKHYLRSILSALALAERKRWMHRDISPENVMVDPRLKLLKIIDWGLAGAVREDGQGSVIGNYRYTAPELLLDAETYDGAVDVWSAGVLFAERLLCYPNGEHLFDVDPNDSSGEDTLISQGKVLGSRNLFDVLEEHEVYMSPRVVLKLGYAEKQSWQSLRKGGCGATQSDTAFDLLDKLLEFDPAKRLPASEALEHEYFST